MVLKLCDFLSSLASRTKNVEDTISKARNESGENLEKRIEESKAELQRKKDEFISHAKAINTRMKNGWDFFKDSINQTVEHIGAEATEKKEAVHKLIEEQKHELSIESAERQYNNSADYAALCVEWASVALLEVENATLQSFAAKQKLDTLRKQAYLN